MDATNNIATDLFFKVRSRFSNLKLGDDSGQITINPEDARFFDFDYMEEDKKIGHVSISLAEPNSMKVYFSNGITEGMDRDQKDGWYGFLRELRKFAKRRLLAFDTRDIAKDNLDKRDYAFLSQYANPASDNDTITKPVGESVMNESNLYGTKTQSFQKLEDTKLIIKHSKKLADDMELKPGARSRNISALFVQNESGERFKYPFVHLAGARAMQRHVANGGAPYDEIGESIVKMSEEIAQLKSFTNYCVRNDLMNSDTNRIVERSKVQLDTLRERINKLSKQSYYEAFKESFEATADVEVDDDVMEQYKDMFTVKNFKEDLTDVFPVIHRLMKEEETVGYDDIVGMTAEAEPKLAEEHEDTIDTLPGFEKFESWVDALGEESPIQIADEEEKADMVKSLNELTGQEFAAGVDGTNAITSLEGIIDDPKLEQDIKAKAIEDANADVRPLLKAWIEENAPDVLDELDFGDMADEPAVGADEVEPQQEDMSMGMNKYGLAAVNKGGKFYSIKDNEITGEFDSIEELKKHQEELLNKKEEVAEGSNDTIMFKGKEVDMNKLDYEMKDISDGMFMVNAPVYYTDGTEVDDADMEELESMEEFRDWVMQDYMDNRAPQEEGVTNETVVGGNAKPADPNSMYARLMGDINEIQVGAMEGNDMTDFISDELGDYLRNGDAPEGSVYEKAIGIIMDAANDGPDAQAEAAEQAGDFLHSELNKEEGVTNEGGNAWDLAVTTGMEIIQDCNDAEECIKRLEDEITGSNEPDESYADKIYQDYIEKIKTDGFDKVRHEIDRQEFHGDIAGDIMDMESQETEGNEFSKKVQDLKAQGAKKGTKFKTSDGEEHTLEGLAEFIKSFYDKNTGTFPKGPEGVATMVGKKFGEQAEQVARKMVERMAPAQEQGAEDLEELGRIKELIQY